MTLSLKSTANMLSVLVAACVLAACATQVREPADAPVATADAAEQAFSQGDYARAAQIYQRAAGQTAAAGQRRQLRFEAGIAAARAGKPAMAREMLGPIDSAKLDAFERARYDLAQTEISINGMPPAKALEQLPPPRSGVPPAIAARVWEKRAQLHFAQNNFVAGIRDLVQRAVWLVDPPALTRNDETVYAKARDAIAYGQGPQSRAARNADRTTRGWLALAAIGQRRWSSREQRDRALAQWEQQYSGHPAARYVLQTRFDYTPRTPFRANQPSQLGTAPRPPSDTIALALPLTGPFERAAAAIRDGFMFAYETDQTAPARPRVYDTNDMSASAILEQARRDDVGILVGPLDKPKVAEMARLSGDIPTIALNYTDASTDNPPGFYQFALAPEDDARTVARHASDKDYTRALALVPGNDWGSRVFDTFRDAFTQRGGEIVDRATYDTEKHDHRDTIQSVLKSYQPGDTDFIFVAAQPVQGRLIRSQLRFYRATDLPMLATSHVYTGTPDPDTDIDLNGVYFTDLPWVVGNGDFIQRRREAAIQRYGDIASRYARLFAMGMDAWRLTDRIAADSLQPGDLFEGMTGVLAVQPNNRIQRYLAWAVFRQGEPEMLNLPSISDAETDTTPTSPWVKP